MSELREINERFVAEQILRDYIHHQKLTPDTVIPTRVFTHALLDDSTNKMTIFISMMSKTLGLLGHGVFIPERNRLMIYDRNGDLILISNQIKFKSINKNLKPIGRF